MERQKIKGFFKILMLLFLVITLICLVGRNHFIFGTALIVGRWVLVVIGILLFYLSTRRTTPKYLQVLISLSLIALLLEFGWNKCGQQTLREGGTTSELSLMSYNLFFKNQDPKSLTQKIKQSDPSILVVQELTPNLETHLNNTIGKNYPYKRTFASKGTHGLGIYSKYRILSNQFLRNENTLPFAQVVEIEIDSKKIQLTNAHLASPAIAVENPENFLSLLALNYQTREQQIQMINSFMLQGKFDAQVLIGDLNTTKYEPLMRQLKSNWVDLFEISGVGSRLNFPNSSSTDPILTLDYILLRGNLKGIKAEVIKGGSSDHLAISGKAEI